MIAILGLVSVVAGSALAYATRWHQPKARILDACAGALLILGLASLGAGLPNVISKGGGGQHIGQNIGVISASWCARFHQRD
ncbi:hypothetical protein QNJ95_37405 [Bradyrhizobium elkanii]|uniref:hypothetical protein n=1 Tax=Bradyrhizobium elkanii TaxID=29448 RepID=UPI00271218D0|nr:hypothetical protein [Bradyrhizobium elkanii]WLA38554.1 hypothetical protein QNJ95_37405 [Bradyrhizobium elkanii]